MEGRTAAVSSRTVIDDGNACFTTGGTVFGAGGVTVGLENAENTVCTVSLCGTSLRRKALSACCFAGVLCVGVGDGTACNAERTP